MTAPSRVQIYTNSRISHLPSQFLRLPYVTDETPFTAPLSRGWYKNIVGRFYLPPVAVINRVGDGGRLGMPARQLSRWEAGRAEPSSEERRLVISSSGPPTGQEWRRQSQLSKAKTPAE